MNSNIDGVIADLQKKLTEQETAVIQSKQLINLLCTQYGRDPIYKDADLAPSSGTQAFASDEFYGQPLAGSMRKILEHRKATGLGPATPREIYDTLVSGGYAFETDNVQNRLIGIRVSLRKSSGTFHRLPEGKQYGLLEWYPKAQRAKNKNDKSEDDQNDEADMTDEAESDMKGGD